MGSNLFPFFFLSLFISLPFYISSLSVSLSVCLCLCVCLSVWFLSLLPPPSLSLSHLLLLTAHRSNEDPPPLLLVRPERARAADRAHVHRPARHRGTCSAYIYITYIHTIIYKRNIRWIFLSISRFRIMRTPNVYELVSLIRSRLLLIALLLTIRM